MHRFWIEVHTSHGPLLGSDGTIPLDGRFGRDRAMAEAKKYVRRLLRIHPHITSFTLSRGSRASSLTPYSLPVSVEECL